MTGPGSRRTLVFNGVGAMLGLLLAGQALLTARGTQIRGVPAEDVALVNQRSILQSDFVTQTQLETGVAFKDASSADKQRVLSDMIDEELLVQRGLEVDLAASDPDIRSAMVAGVDLQVDADVLAAQPDDAALHAYFAAHADRYVSDGTMDLRDLIPRGTGADPQGLVTALRAGMPVDAAAAKFAMGDSGQIGRGENYDFAVKAKLGAKLFKDATALSAGQVDGPILDNGTPHVLVMLARKPAVPRGFDAARDTVWQDLQHDARTRVEKANLAYLRSRADIAIANGATQ